MLLDSGGYKSQKGTSGAGHVADTAVHPGESEQFDRTFGGPMCLASGIKTADALINNGPCVLYGYIIHAATAVAAITLEDGTAAGGTVKVTVPAAKPVGEYIFPVGLYCETGLFANYATSATGSISILYLPAIA